ncbi:MAG: TdeIII family type II restriction endonuclease [Anaerolineaceae bacterium]|nr:TdeIII family type II restriction endonuclease [Anaerolineaceae bacterium]
MDKIKIEAISIEVIKTLYKRFSTFPEDADNNRNAPFHEAFLSAFSDKLEGKVKNIPYFISLSSWLHGLNTTLGQSFFENVANILAAGEKRTFKQNSNNLPQIYSGQTRVINQIITDLKNSSTCPDLRRETKLLVESKSVGELNPGKQFTVDVFFEEDCDVFAVELKSVKPNAGEMRGEKQKILEGKASLMQSFPNKEIHYYIGFPFDPNVDVSSQSVTSYDKAAFLKSIIDGQKYFDPAEILLSSELWDFLSGEGKTMEKILKIINRIATPKFLEIYHSILERNIDSPEYLKALKAWYLVSEEFLVRNDDAIRKELNSASSKRIYNTSVFIESSSNDATDYNWRRFNQLRDLIR